MVTSIKMINFAVEIRPAVGYIYKKNKIMKKSIKAMITGKAIYPVSTDELKALLVTYILPYV